MSGNAAEDPDPAAPTEAAGIAEADTRSAWAWGEAEDEGEAPTQRLTSSRITAGAVAVSVVLIAAAGGVAWWQLRGDQDPPAAPPTSAPSATVAAPPPPPSTVVTTVLVQPPVTVTALPPPPTLSSVPGVAPDQMALIAVYDQQLLNRMTSEGMTISDSGLVTRNAHIVCARLSSGLPTYEVAAEYSQKGHVSMVAATQFVSWVSSTYPACP